MTQMAIAFDLDRCLGCYSCIVACKQEHNLQSGSFRNRILRIGPTMGALTSKHPFLEMYYLPILCQHCENPPCVEACPNGAINRREDGIVIINENECDSCRLCITACPYDRYIFNEKEHIEKCTMCVNLIEKGDNPACVKTCMSKCIYAGDVDDPNSGISKKIKEAGQNVHTLADMGNKPTIRYILHPNTANWRAISE